MAMTDLKRTEADKKVIEDRYSVGCGAEAEDYPYNLHFSLDGMELDKLGLQKMTVGEEHTVTATVRVTGYRESDSENESHRSAELVIKGIDFGDDRKSDTEAFYGESK